MYNYIGLPTPPPSADLQPPLTSTIGGSLPSLSHLTTGGGSYLHPSVHNPHLSHLSLPTVGTMHGHHHQSLQQPQVKYESPVNGHSY